MMKSLTYLLTVSTLLTIAGQESALAEELALSFELAPLPADEVPETAAIATAPTETATPLPIPPHGANPPVSRASGSTIAASRYGGSEAVALAQTNAAAAAKMLPPPPTQPAAKAQDPPQSSPPKDPVADNSESPALSFANPPATVVVSEPGPSPEAPPPGPVNLFDGGSDSLVARIVGSAEGTRTADGQRTAAYFGHRDPGNGVWNLGTFSYQHGAQTPEEADQKQLKRLQSQTQVLVKKAQEKDIDLSLAEKLNGIDLANQSPLAAIGRVGYIDRLAEARQMGLAGEEAIVWARTRSYINPDTNQWNAPGLGNTAASIRRDQHRRMQAIAQALQAYEQQQPAAESQPALAQSDPALEDDLPFRLREADTRPAATKPEQDLKADSPQPTETMASVVTAPDALPSSRVYAPTGRETSDAPKSQSSMALSAQTQTAPEAVDAMLAIDLPEHPR